jgi:1-acyl-sn-glycerol-3-phosphate acyltransferase
MRWIIILYLVCSFIFKAIWISLTNKGFEKLKRLSINAHQHAKKLIPSFKITLKTEGTFPPGSFLAVANHVSYVDVLMLAAIYPSIYISYTRIERIFFVGGIAGLGGTLFLEREKKHKMHQDIASIAAMLESGNPVTIFPEGRCTNGDNVREFHGAYIEAAVNAGIPVVPICLAYKSVNGELITQANRDFICIYGKTPFGPHMLRMIRKLNCMELHVRIFPPINGVDRKEIAFEAHKNVSGYYKENSPIPAHAP